MANPIRFKDFADLSDAKEAAKIFDDLERDIKGSFKNIGEFVKKQLTDVNTSIKQLSDTAKALEKGGITGKNAGAVKEITKQYDELASSQNRVKETLNGLAKTEEFATNSIKGLKNEAKRLQAEYDKLVTTENKNSASSRKLATEIRKVKSEAYDLSTETRRVNNEFKAVDGSYNALVLRNKQLGNELRNLPVFLNKSSREFRETAQRARELEKEFADNTQRLKDFDSRLNQNFRNVGNYRSAIGGMGGSLRDLALNLTGAYLGITGLQQAFRFFVSTNAEISDSLADVRKTTGFTDQEVQNLLSTVKQFNTRTSIQGLLDIAKIGGQIGVAGKDIAGFTKAVDVAAVALGDEFSGGIEEISSSLGKINAVYKVTERLGVEEGIINTGSAINALGAAGLATAPYLSDFTQRLGGIASNTDQSVQNILGLAAVTEELGLTSEVSSSALSQVFTKMSTDTAKFARIAGKDLKDFERLINEDINEAFLQVLQGLQKSSGSTTEFSRAIKSLGLEGARSTSVIASLAGNVDLIREKQALANVEFEKGTSLQEEFNIKNDTFAASLEKLSKAFVSLSTGQNGFSNFLKSAADEATGLVQALELLSNATGKVDFFNRLFNSFSAESIKEFNEELGKPAALYKEAAEKVKKENDALVQQFVKGGWEIEKAQQLALQNQIGSLDKLNKKLSDIEGRIKYQRQLKAATDTQSEAYKEQTDKVNALFEERRKLRAQLEYFTSLQKGATKATEDNNLALEDGKKEVSEYTKEIEKLSKAYQDLVNKMDVELDVRLGKATDVQSLVDNADIEGVNNAGSDAKIKAKIEEYDYLQKLDQDYLNEVRDRYGDEVEAALQASEQITENLRKEQEKRNQIQEAGFYFAAGLSDAIAEVNANNFQKESEALQAQKEYELSLVGDNANAKKQIEERFNREQAQLRRENAKREKALAIFNIAINTAQGITAALASVPPNVPLSVAIGVIGGIQAGVVASKPLPAFEKGTKNAPEGLALVGEKGWEFVERQGKFFQTNDGPQIMPLKRGDKVYPHRESEMMLMQAEKAIQMNMPLKAIEVHDRIINRTEKPNPQKQDRGYEKIVKAINSKPNVSLAREADKIVEVIEYKNHKKTILNKYYN